MAAELTQTTISALVSHPPDIVFYHQPCADGLASRMNLETAIGAKAVSKIEFRPWIHGKDKNLNAVDGKTILFLDACPTIGLIEKDLSTCKQIVIIDHHDNPDTRSLKTKMDAAAATEQKQHQSKVILHLDQTRKRCASLMLFEGLFPGSQVPFWQRCINSGDTDLNLDRTREDLAMHAFLTSEANTKSVEAFRAACLVDEKTALAKGEELIRPYEEEAEKSVTSIESRTLVLKSTGQTYRLAYVDCSSHHVIAAITRRIFRGDGAKTASSLMIDTTPPDVLCIRFIQTGTGVQSMSLRSAIGSGIDVSLIAKEFGGGGHPNASGVQHRRYLAYETEKS